MISRKERPNKQNPKGKGPYEKVTKELQRLAPTPAASFKQWGHHKTRRVIERGSAKDKTRGYPEE